jgi:DNA-3-methyladenine glycosylase
VPGLADALDGHVLDVAPRLLGSVLRHDEVAVRLTEVEAYDGPNDPGSHSFNGRTARNAVMFGPPGHLYVYFTYGMHHCCNVVVGAEGAPSAVLLRAGEVVDGVARARSRRRGGDRDLARGPARLCQALGIDLSHNGADLSSGSLTLDLDETFTGRVRTGPRVGLRRAADRPLRFWVDGDPTVSTYRPAVVRHRVQPPASDDGPQRDPPLGRGDP